MSDPLEEFDELTAYFQSRRFWSDLLTAAGFLVLLLCFRTGPLAPTAAEATHRVQPPLRTPRRPHHRDSRQSVGGSSASNSPR